VAPLLKKSGYAHTERLYIRTDIKKITSATTQERFQYLFMLKKNNKLIGCFVK